MKSSSVPCSRIECPGNDSICQVFHIQNLNVSDIGECTTPYPGSWQERIFPNTKRKFGVTMKHPRSWDTRNKRSLFFPFARQANRNSFRTSAEILFPECVRALRLFLLHA
jgi:hypothetical protein